MHSTVTRGFTLVETLVAVALMGVVGAALVSVLAGGLQVWQRAAEFSRAGQSAVIGLSQLRHDLHSLRTFSLLPFEGSYDRYEAAAVGASGLAEEAILGRLGYFLRERDQTLCRSFVPYPMANTKRLTDRCQTILEHVSRVRFHYFGKDPQSGVEGWVEHWHGDVLPLAVRVEVSTQEGRQPPVTHGLLVTLPQRSAEEQPTP